MTSPDTSLDAEAELSQLLYVVLLALTGAQAQARALSDLPDMRARDDVEDVMTITWLDAVLAAGEQDLRACTRLVPVEQLVGGDLTPTPTAWLWPRGFRSACTIGDLNTARRLEAGLDERRRTEYIPPAPRSNHDLARARLAKLDGQPTATVEKAYEDAVTHLRAAGSPYHLAHGLLDHANHITACGGDPSPLREEPHRSATTSAPPTSPNDCNPQQPSARDQSAPGRRATGTPRRRSRGAASCWPMLIDGLDAVAACAASRQDPMPRRARRLFPYQRKGPRRRLVSRHAGRRADD